METAPPLASESPIYVLELYLCAIELPLARRPIKTKSHPLKDNNIPFPIPTRFPNYFRMFINSQIFNYKLIVLNLLSPPHIMMNPFPLLPHWRIVSAN